MPDAPRRLPGESDDEFQRRRASWRLEQHGYEGISAPAAPPTEPPTLPPGVPRPPDINDPVYDLLDQFGNVTGRDYSSYYLDLKRYQDLTEGDGGDGAAYHPPAWRPGELGLLQEQQEAANMVSYLESVARGVELELQAGSLSLAQAAEEFDRRLDAFTEAGTQMADLWQWTVPKGSAGKPLHADIRGALGMRPWISDPIEYDPVAESQRILEDLPPMSAIPSTDPYTEAVRAAEGLLG